MYNLSASLYCFSSISVCVCVYVYVLHCSVPLFNLVFPYSSSSSSSSSFIAQTSCSLHSLHITYPFPWYLFLYLPLLFLPSLHHFFSNVVYSLVTLSLPPLLLLVVIIYSFWIPLKRWYNTILSSRLVSSPKIPFPPVHKFSVQFELSWREINPLKNTSSFNHQHKSFNVQTPPNCASGLSWRSPNSTLDLFHHYQY